MEKQPSVKKLSSGWTHMRWSAECWAQIPPGFSAAIIPDVFIFHPSWNRDRINRCLERSSKNESYSDSD